MANWHLPQRCEHCGALDNRDAEHARGCPWLPPVSAARLLAVARQCETAWIEKTTRERRARGAAA
jgi:hypothetical protein